MLSWKNKVESSFDKSQTRRVNQLLLIESKNDKGVLNQRPFIPIFHRNKTACNMSINDSTIQDDMDHNGIENDVVDEEEQDLIDH